MSENNVGEWLRISEALASDVGRGIARLDPKTGAVVPVAAKRVPFFKVGKELKLRVDGKAVLESERAVSEGV